MLEGEIDVTQAMDRAARLRVWKARQDRDAEWYALKVWWRANQRVRRSYGTSLHRLALSERRRIERLFAAELGRAWPKWQRVQDARWYGWYRDD